MYWLFWVSIYFSGDTHWEILLDTLDIYPSDPFVMNVCAVAADGTIAFKDNQAGRLVFTDSEGHVKAQFGQKGLGPHEFFNMDGLAWVADLDAFYVTDRGTLRISKFNTDGVLLDSARHPFMRAPVFDRSGEIYYMKRVGRDIDYRHQIRRYSPTTASERLLFDAKMDPIATPMIWHDRLVFAPARNFVVVCHTRSDRIHILDRTTGERLNHWSAKLPRQSIDATWQERYMRDFMARVSAKGRPPKGFQIDQRNEWPALQHILIDHLDRIWVFLFPIDEMHPTPFRVYDRRGKLLASGRLLGQAQALDESYLYALQVKERGWSLTRYRLEQLLR